MPTISNHETPMSESTNEWTNESHMQQQPLHYEDSTSYMDHSESHLLTEQQQQQLPPPQCSSNNVNSMPLTSPAAEQQERPNEIRSMAKRATRRIRHVRLFVLTSLVVIGTLASCGIWYGIEYLLNQQQLQAMYWPLVDAASSSVARNAQTLQTVSRTMSASVTRLATASNQTFPFVVIPLLEPLVQQARLLTAIVATIYSPLVSQDNRRDWELYSVRNQDKLWQQQQQSTTADIDMNNMDAIFPYVYALDESATPPLRTRTYSDAPFLPLWQTSPPTKTSYIVNYNQIISMDSNSTQHVVQAVIKSKRAVMTQAATLLELLNDDKSGYLANTLADVASKHTNALYTYLVEPILDNDQTVVGMLQHLVPLQALLQDLLPTMQHAGLLAVVSNSQKQSFTYQWNKNDNRAPTLLGTGDLHDAAFDETALSVPLLKNDNCAYTVTFYASRRLYDTLQQQQTVQDHHAQVIATVLTALLFFGLLVGFAAYDSFVARRNRVVVNAAARSNAILSSMFPTNVQARLFHRSDDDDEHALEHTNHANEHQDELVELQDASRNNSNGLLPKLSIGKRGSMLGSVLDMGSKVTNTAISSVMQTPKLSLKTFLFEGLSDMEVEEADGDIGYKGKPIADLFTESTVLFADIAGFTAWASVREPTQVFTLLETVYRAFDEIAKKRKVFKVETVGDCYVAVTGVPEPQKDHATIMCRFARDCMLQMKSLTKKLEKALGPDTGELDMRIGIHSGPVIAGVLRGERSRFQLFGDTMNTASRTESTGIKGRIQVSLDTATLLTAAGKGHWLIARDDKVIAKGKGEMQTYWLTTQREMAVNGDVECSADIPEIQFNDRVDNKIASLIEWNTDVLLRLIKSIVARRMALQQINSHPASPVHDDGVQIGIANESEFTHPMAPVIDEVKEIIALPNFDYKSIAKQIPPESVEIDEVVIKQLHAYVSKIANMYHNNPFHNFEHASHVTMSVTKLLSRIVAPSDLDAVESLNKTGKTLHDHTYGITSDPLTQFACVFCALIHDVDHSGVTNAQLIKEEKEIALIYQGKSVAEQNSVNLAWNLLMEQEYQQLRECIYTSETSFKRFRQLVVNGVMATDIVDKELKTLRNKRWENAFSEADAHEKLKDAVDRKATIVIEHLIQASDVSHTMQHWHIYRKWNEQNFLECYRAWKDGRSAGDDPSLSWYKGELGFFDFYIIPLAKKLKDCGVFGVSSDEYLNYAQRNRKEWEARGEEVVREMVIKANRLFGRRISQGEKRRDSNESQRRSSNGSQNRRSSNGSTSRRTSNEGRRDSNDSQLSSCSWKSRRSQRQSTSGCNG
ncbi:hypothetical protein MPSEU_000868600 [Mayamaea pseudoterrestris]|nr:hypothetical protein MPSEU_000868600 [Mayamaea pseudoterrestris]